MIEIPIVSLMDITLNTGAGEVHELAVGEPKTIVFKNPAEFEHFKNMGFIKEDKEEKPDFILPAIVPGNSEIPVVGAHDTIDSIAKKVILKSDDLESGVMEALKDAREQKEEPEDDQLLIVDTPPVVLNKNGSVRQKPGPKLKNSK